MKLSVWWRFYILYNVQYTLYSEARDNFRGLGVWNLYTILKIKFKIIDKTKGVLAIPVKHHALCNACQLLTKI